MIRRQIANELERLTGDYPVVTVLGPRQAGKTTLAQMELPDYGYAILELPEVRQRAQDDPKAFLGQFRGNVVLDEIQRAPELLSHIQVVVDRENATGSSCAPDPVNCCCAKTFPNPWPGARRC